MRAWPLLLAVAGLAAPVESHEPLRYELDVRLDPDRQHVAVAGRVSLHVEAGKSEFSFGLHETFRIAECAVNGKPARCARVEPVPPRTTPTSREVTVGLPEGVGSGLVELEIRYDGAIESRPGWGDPASEGPFMDDSAGPDRVELALYSNWYPFFGFGPSFDVEMELTIPRVWAVACIGQELDRHEAESETTTRWEARSVNDVVIVASPRLRSKDVETAAGRVRVQHTRLPESYVLREVQETEQTLLLFTKILGGTSGGGTLQHVYSPRDWGQGFARPGLIVVSEGRVLRALEEDPETSSLYGHAHEAGHFWWRFGRDQGDWINETFAEYFALLAIQSIHGEDSFQDTLAERRQRVGALPEDAPSLAVVARYGDGDGYTIRYEKGALMLHAFREHMGDAAFFGACRGFYEAIKGTSATTDDFRVHWSRALKDDELLAAWLDAPGRSPVPPGK